MREGGGQKGGRQKGKVFVTFWEGGGEKEGRRGRQKYP